VGRMKLNESNLTSTQLKTLRKNVKKHTLNNIFSSYDTFKKDVRGFKDSVAKLSNDQKSVLCTMKKNINRIAIFLVDDNNEYDIIQYKTPVPTIPYEKFYIGTNVAEIIDNDVYRINGFHFLDIGESLLCSYFWSRTISDGWKPMISIISKKNLELNRSAKKIIEEMDEIDLPQCSDIRYGKTTPYELEKKIAYMATYKAIHLLKKMLYKISKNDYNSYSVYSHGIYTKKTITNSHHVITHKRHFWEDSGRFIIPKLPRNEILDMGYGIEDMVFRNGELRKDVPYKVISGFIVGDTNNKKPNKEYNLIKKKIWRCEEKIYKILIEIYPDNIIRRHDRRTLKGLELDFNLPELRIGIEYDGEQHFDRDLYQKLYGDGFDTQVKRDRMKDKLCVTRKIKLLRIKYDEPLTKSYIKKKLKAIGVSYV
jgi:hypothetical protein